MKRYVAIDSGKFATKVAEYIPGETEEQSFVKVFSIRTKASEGDFRDDAIEANTVVVNIDGETYKIGNGARGEGAELDTNKKSDVHRLCTLTALAYLASDNSEDPDEFCVAIGLPAKDWSVVSKRIDYKDYILPEGEVNISIKKRSTSPVKEKKFKIAQRYVFPESIGALFMDETINSVTPTTITGVIDLGNLNLNATLWQGVEPVLDKSATAELGGAILIQELSQELSANIATCDELITANILKSEDRCLPASANLTENQIEESRKLIKRVLLQHAEKVKRVCRARNWSLDVTNIIAIGGTSKDLEEELKQTFGNNIVVLKDSSYCNALGYLRMLCARIPEVNKVIPFNFPSKEQSSGKEKVQEDGVAQKSTQK